MSCDGHVTSTSSLTLVIYSVLVYCLVSVVVISVRWTPCVACAVIVVLRSLPYLDTSRDGEGSNGDI